MLKQVGILLVGVFIIYITFFGGSFSGTTGGPVEVNLKYGGKVNVNAYERFHKESSFIGWNFYNPEKEYLVIELQKTYYDFCGFSKNEWKSYKKSDSLGKYFNKNITGKYDCR